MHITNTYVYTYVKKRMAASRTSGVSRGQSLPRGQSAEVHKRSRGPPNGEADTSESRDPLPAILRALIQEKERLALHSIRELGDESYDKVASDGVNKKGGLSMRAQKVQSTISWLKIKDGGLWSGYAFLCEHLQGLSEQRYDSESPGPDSNHGMRMADLNSTPALTALDPPSWPHPLPSTHLIHQEIVVIFASAHAANYTNIVCTKARGSILASAEASVLHRGDERPIEQSFTPFADFVTLHFLNQYKDKRIALAAMHSFLSQISYMLKPGINFSPRAELFAHAISGKVSIFACWSFSEAVRSLKRVQNLIRLDTAVGRSTAVHLLYGTNFATRTEMVQVENALGEYFEMKCGLPTSKGSIRLNVAKGANEANL